VFGDDGTECRGRYISPNMNWHDKDTFFCVEKKEEKKVVIIIIIMVKKKRKKQSRVREKYNVCVCMFVFLSG